MAAIMAALYFDALGPNDRVAVKPHAGPVLHAIHYLLGGQDRATLENFRGFGGAQSYPSRTKDRIPVDFSTGSVGLGVAITLFASLVQDWLSARGALAGRPARPLRRADGRCRARRRQHLRSPDRGPQARRPQPVVDRRLQPPEPRRDQRRPHVRAVRRHFRAPAAGGSRRSNTASAFSRRPRRAPAAKLCATGSKRSPTPTIARSLYQGGAAWRTRLDADLGDSRRTPVPRQRSTTTASPR